MSKHFVNGFQTLVGPSAFKSTIGFEDVISQLQSAMSSQANLTYPPYNILRNLTESGDTMIPEKYTIEMAIAGFESNEITIVVENDQLKVSGQKKSSYIETAFIHHGISMRDFERTFTLGQYVEVTSADLKNGMLSIELKKVIPVEKQPKKIKISSVA